MTPVAVGFRPTRREERPGVSGGSREDNVAHLKPLTETARSIPPALEKARRSSQNGHLDGPPRGAGPGQAAAPLLSEQCGYPPMKGSISPSSNACALPTSTPV